MLSSDYSGEMCYSVSSFLIIWCLSKVRHRLDGRVEWEKHFDLLA
jgi:hypothetical protein